MPNPQPTQTSKNILLASRKLWIILGIIVLIVIGFAAKQLYDTYHDRPLATGMQYVGRDFSSGCLIGLLKFGCDYAYSESFYYATDTPPMNIIRLFPGWKIEKVKDDKQVLRNGLISDSVGYWITNKTSNRKSFYEYIHNKADVISASHLLKTDKKYIIVVPKEDYDQLRLPTN